METITFKGVTYPAFQASGFAARFAFPFAQEFCKGVGFDIGCNRAEWSYPGSILIDPLLQPEYDAMNLPPIQVDYIFSSHCIEHLSNWSDALNYWHTKLKRVGVLFLYLPDMSRQGYWRPWHNKKHLHYITPSIMSDYFNDHAIWDDVRISGTDLNASFYVIAERKYNSYKL